MFGQSPASLVVCAGVLLAYVVNKHTQLTRMVAISMGFCGLAAGNREINMMMMMMIMYKRLHYCTLHCTVLCTAVNSLLHESKLIKFFTQRKRENLLISHRNSYTDTAQSC